MLTVSSIITAKESSLVQIKWSKFQGSLHSLNQVHNIAMVRVHRGIIQEIHLHKDLPINQDTVLSKPPVYMHVIQQFFNAQLQKQI